ncbi:MAG: RNA methyltransferase [Planctomycetota bacterium]
MKYLRSLARKKVRVEEGLLLLEGGNVVREALAAGVVEEIYRGPDAEVAVPAGIPVVELSGPDVEQLSETRTPAGLFALARDPVGRVERFAWPEQATVLVADGVADPGNLGTLIRTAAALGCAAIVVPDGSVEPTNPKVVRASAGALFRRPVLRGDRTALAAAGFAVWVADAAGEPVESIATRPARLALLVGNEPRGVDESTRAAADRTVAVTLAAEIESLNVAMAAGILLHALARAPVDTA